MPKFAVLKQSIFVRKIAICIFNSSDAVAVKQRQQARKVANIHWYEKVVVVDPEAYTYDNEVIKKAQAMGKPGLVDIRSKDDNCVFTVEYTGSIKASQLVPV
ncbi:hypothetical protein SADUNF_Sadunf16G0182600 [Salix dunnii]|uniref:Uncharacterized protein n=1 Tax=Salix dunnii TaxID=1413687 RepID=A0A835MGV3_9ROSI|nr:hypothetical protein SADUNF_Sadunf16G0182600 [Salix dunnii]